jgi:adenosine kinase
MAITGSIATDHLMTFPGRFADSLVVERLDKVSLSFLVEELDVRRGGVAANICFGLANVGVQPVLVGAVGEDFLDYRSWLERHGIDCASVHVSETRHTARFVCTTDADQAQIASFYSGAMAEAREIEIHPIAQRVGGLDLVVVSPNDPEAMLRHSDECRERGIPFAADPSQQLARMDGPEIRRLVDGATYLFCNEYESALLEQKTGWSHDDVLARVGTRVTTLGSQGSRIDSVAGECVRVGVVPGVVAIDPTGVGDAYRAGYLAGVAWGVSPERSAQVGSLLAASVIETVGPQEYELTRGGLLARCAKAFGDDAAADLEPHLVRMRG